MDAKDPAQPGSLVPTVSSSLDDLLEYNSTYRVLICRQCQYAIQKSALRSHLLRHKIYRGKREQLLSSIAHLEILEPDHVPLPSPDTAPVNLLPVLSGYCCTTTGCGNLCASSKRMRRHWSEVHGMSENVPDLTSLCRPATLQTFFRGTKLRYFEVSPSPYLSNGGQSRVVVDTGPGTSTRHESATDSEGASQRANVYKSSKGRDSGVDQSHRCLPKEPSLVQFNLETLSYFHNFIAKTSLTLPSITTPESAVQHWQTDAVACSLRHKWLACGLLAISACHLAASTAGSLEETIHVSNATQFFDNFVLRWQDSSIAEDRLDAEAPVELSEEEYRLGEQIKHILHFANPAFGVPQRGINRPETQTPLKSLMVALWDLAAYTSLPPVADLDHVESFAQAYSILKMKPPSNADGCDSHMGGTEALPAALERLRVLPYRMAMAFGEPDNAQDMIATLSAIASLIGCCDALYASDSMGTAWQAMMSWLNKVSEGFKQKVLGLSDLVVCDSQRAPQCSAALIVVAHWAVYLVQGAERRGCWFLKGVTERLLKEAMQRLPEQDFVVRNLVIELVA